MGDVRADIELVERGYAAFSGGDVPTLRELIDPNVTWRVAGSSPLSGVKEGIEEVLGYFGTVAQETGGTLRVELTGCLADGHGHVLGLSQTTGRRAGRSLQMHEGILFTIHDGRVVETIQLMDDVSAFDAFWAPADAPAGATT
jgi:ketosteroid isomerase-like protein